jgi:hypothetical protein
MRLHRFLIIFNLQGKESVRGVEGPRDLESASATIASTSGDRSELERQSDTHPIVFASQSMTNFQMYRSPPTSTFCLASWKQNEMRLGTCLRDSTYIPPQEETSATVYDVPVIVGVFASNGEFPLWTSVISTGASCHTSSQIPSDCCHPGRWLR